jgi:Peptidase M66
MKRTKSRLQISLFLCSLMISITGLTELKAQDQITLNNSSGNPIGLLVDGKLNGSFVNDKTYVSSGSPALVGQFSRATGQGTNEVMAFTQDRPLAVYTNVPWSTGNDNMMVPFANQILIPVTIWVLYGDFGSVSTKAANDLLTASSIYRTERVGVGFSTVTFMDATANPLASRYYNYDNSTMATTIRTDIGYVNGQINIYYINSIVASGVQYTQAACVDQIGGTMVFVGSTVITTVLAHEMGHDFSLEHVHSGQATQWFDYSNVMSTNGSPNVIYLTEGQVLRMHLTSTSALNDTYNARPGLLIRDCAATATTATNTCPAVQKRIWADGIYPAN